MIAATQPKYSPRDPINAIQGLRAYAALTVMVGHAILEVVTTNTLQLENSIFPLLAGVDLFFVISGFIMYHTTQHAFGAAGASVEFWRRRVIRIVPLYWMFTTAMVFVLVVLGGVVRSTELDLWNVVSSYLFIPAERPGGRIAPVLSLGWTLNFEMFFYVLFGIALAFPKRLGVSLLLVALLLLSLIGAIVRPDFAAFRFWTNSIILEFGFGILLAVAYGRLRVHANLAASLILIVLGVVLMWAFLNVEAPRFLSAGIPATVTLAGCLLLPTRFDRSLPSWLILLGNSSYALYLCHRFVLRAVTIAFDRLPIPDQIEVLLYVVTTTAISVGTSIVIFLWIEKPALALLNDRLGTRRSQPASAQA